MRGVFDGVIATSDGEEYHLERTEKFFKDKRDHHSVIYRNSDVQFDPRASSCAAKDEIYRRMQELQGSAKPVRPYSERHSTVSKLFVREGEREKRSDTITGGRFCHILVAADHLFHERIGGGNPDQTITEIVTVFAQVQDIFSATDFDGDGSADNITPLIARIEILTTGTPGYRFASNNIAVDDFLDLWSQENHNEFCLSLLLTYRDFANGVLGLAWVAQPPGGNRGGVCEQRVRLSVGDRNLNTAIVTFLNYGREQPRSVSVVTIAHELGHNFGSPVSAFGMCRHVVITWLIT